MDAVLDRSLLEKRMEDIDFSSLDPVEELRKINPRGMEQFDLATKGRDKVFLLRAYDIQSPIEEMLVQIALDKYEQIIPSLSEESRVRREMAELAAKGIEIDSPEMEAEWEAKLATAREKDKEAMLREKERRAPKGAPSDADNDDALSKVSGLGVKSIEKLSDAGIKTATEFYALSPAQKTTILGPLVASKFADT